MQTLLKSAMEKLNRGQIERPRWTAEQLLAHRLGCRPIDLYLNSPSAAANANLRPSLRVPPRRDEAISFQADVAARIGGVPLQYLLGTASFYGREFIVGPGVFIPRPETEVLVEAALESASGSSVVADIGTGCGAIAVTMALERPSLKVAATDFSSAALSFARRNAQRFGVELAFLKADLAEIFPPNSLDRMVANLPYLDSETVPDWPQPLHWEPLLALNGGKGGLRFIRRLIHQAALSLRPQGRLILEIGEEQAKPIEAILQGTPFRVEKVVQDLNQRDRVVVLWKN